MSSVWRMPVVLGALTTIGLVGALFGEGVWDLLSALALAAPVVVGGWHALRRPRRRTGSSGHRRSRAGGNSN